MVDHTSLAEPVGLILSFIRITWRACSHRPPKAPLPVSTAGGPGGVTICISNELPGVVDLEEIFLNL